MKCPHCNNFDLIYEKEPLNGIQRVVCRNPKCKFDGWYFPAEIIQALIDGKKAQKALEFVKMHIESLQTAAELCLEKNLGDVRAYERDIEIAKLLQTAISSYQPDQPKEE